MPSMTNHSYVKYKSIYSRHKDDKLRKKVAYQQLSIAGMQLFYVIPFSNAKFSAHYLQILSYLHLPIQAANHLPVLLLPQL